VYLETKSQVENFNTQVEKLEKEIPITKSEMTEIIKRTDEVAQNFQAESGEELNKVTVDILTTQERINAAKDQVNRTEIGSPVNGIVSKVNINTVGGVVKSGDRLAEIVPLDETLVVEGRIATSDRGKIWEGLPVVVRVTAYDYTIYGSLDGELTYVSANSFRDQNEQEYYVVRVTLNRQSMKGGKHIYPGMIADVHIIAGEMSVLKSLLKPLWYIRDNALRES
jgi:HlyD family type I secretion membrane fusion protein